MEKPKKPSESPAVVPEVVDPGDTLRQYTEFTDERVEMFLQRLRSGVPITHAAGSVGIDRTTVYYRRDRDPEFSLEMAKARAQGVASHLTNINAAAFGRPAEYDTAGNLVRPAISPTWQASAWWLERLHPKNFSLKLEVRVGDEPDDPHVERRVFHSDGQPVPAAAAGISDKVRQ